MIKEGNCFMKKALMVATVVGFIASFEKSDINILQEMGYEVHCAANYSRVNDPEKIKQLDEMGVVRQHIEFARSPFSKRNIQAYQELDRIITGEHFDIVHCHTPVGGVLGRMAARKNHVPVVMYTAHGFHFFRGCPVKNRVIFYPIEKNMSRITDILITINNEDYQVAKNRFHAKRTERIHGVGIDIEKFGVPSDCRNEKRAELGVADDEKLLLSVGELDRDKNHIEVLEAMKILAPKGYKYIIAGNGSLKKPYTDYIKANGLENAVYLLGYRRDIPELLKAADIYIFPSLFEGLSVALMEAAAAKIPIACSEVRGNIDTVVTEESYFSPQSPLELVSAVEGISNMNDEEKSKMLEKNYKNLLKYRLSEVEKEMARIYKIADRAVEKRKKT